MMRHRLMIVPFIIASLVSPAGAARTVSTDGMSPVTRVVELLKGLQKQVDEEGKKEEDLYEKFVCWGKGVITAKKASNTDAKSRIETLKKYEDDLKNGRIEMTSERATLEKELEEILADMQLAKETREKETADFESAKEEMEAAITALTAAIEVLTTATEDSKEGVLLGLRGRTESALGSSTEQAAALNRAVGLGQKFLTKADALFLQRLLTGEVPKPDWKKLNRAATFKKSYKARSFKIQSVLAKLLATFESNLKDAEAKEEKAQKDFETIYEAKKKQRDTAQDNLVLLTEEKGASSMSKEEAKAEYEMLEEQVTNDEGYITQVEGALEDKKEEWKMRKEVRTSETEAISKAIAILYSDDARDLFKKSFTSQGYLFLQENEQSKRKKERRAGLSALRKVSSSVRDRRLAKLVAIAKEDAIAEVMTAIEDMLTTLKDEEASDLEKKETCEKDRAKDTREAIVAAREMDEMTDSITSLTAEIKEITEDIASKEKEVEDIEKELKEAEDMRDKEKAEYEKSKKDDEDAKQLIDDAVVVLEEFYSTVFMQKSKSAQPKVAAGEAPPPPPQTWESEYTGKGNEANGVLSILGMIKEDIEKDLSTAEAEETKAQDLYDETKTASEEERDNLNTLISDLEVSKGDKEQSVEDTKGERRTKKDEVDAIMEKISAANPGCTFFTVNFPVRARNRQTEMDGLEKALFIFKQLQEEAEPEP